MGCNYRLKHGWLLVPGAATVVFALLSIGLPVGSDGLGAGVSREPGLTGELARWARDIHDGYWRQATPRRALIRTTALARGQSRGTELCAMGRAEEAVAWYRTHGVLTVGDRDALFQLSELLVVEGAYDRAEWYVREADILVGGGTMRNNLAWHYTQTDQRPEQALSLALSAVTSERNAATVDTLAWAYWCNDRLDAAATTARETLRLADVAGEPVGRWYASKAHESSRRLLALVGRADAPGAPARPAAKPR